MPGDGLIIQLHDEVYGDLPVYPVIRQKRDTAANWTNHNPVLLNGELILVDTAEGQLRAKIGDGIKTYTQLPFTDEALRALITEVDNNNSAVVVTKNGESRLLDTFNIVKLSEEEYRQLIDSNTLDPDALYLTEGEDNQGVQPDWNQNDNTKPDYIKNRPLIATNDDAMDLLAEIGIITPITNSNGEILTSSSNEIYSL